MRKLITVVGLMCLGAVGHWGLRQALEARWFDSIGADMAIVPSGKPNNLVEVVVRKQDGTPFSGLEVRVNDTSGTRRATTDASGRAALPGAESMIEDISIEGRPIARSNFLRRLDARSGLEIYFIRSE